jgi:hypothetical protein
MPYDAFHLTGRAALVRSAAHTLDVSSELSRYWFDADFDDRRVWWFDLDTTDRVTLTRFLSLLGRAGYRWEDDSEDGTTNGVDLECGVEYTRGYLTMELTVEYDLLDIASNREDGLGVFLNCGAIDLSLCCGEEGGRAVTGSGFADARR